MVISTTKARHKRANHFMTDREVSQLWQYVGTHWGPKFRMILAFALFRGLRIGEILSINILDFQEDYTKLRVITEKSYIDDVLPLIQPLTDLVKSYILKNSHTFKDGYLFPFYSSRRLTCCMTTSTAEALFSKIRRKIGLINPGFLERTYYKSGHVKYRISFHSCRRWFETRIYDHLGDRKKLADIMRYLETSTVDTYIDPYETWLNERAILESTFSTKLLDLTHAALGQHKLLEFI